MEKVKTKIPDFTIRQAQKGDCALILQFIKGLAEYEKLLDEVTATEETLCQSLFEKNGAEVIFGEYKGETVAFALFFHNFSTFKGKAGLYLEDLFVKPEHRGKGFGRTMLAYLAYTAKKRGLSRFEWICLDWNSDALAVYRKLGAVPMSGWTIQRLSGEPLKSLANSL